MAQYRRILIFALLLTLCFALPITRWIRFGLKSELFSYVLLVPFISAYLIWMRRTKVLREARPASLQAAIIAAVGLGFLTAGIMCSSQNALTYQMISYCCLLWGGGFALLGKHAMRALAFPALFLLFVAPIPPVVVKLLEAGLQRGSAELAYRFIRLANIPILRSGFDFHMPHLSLSVAPQCSGIRSSLVLFLISLIAGHLFCRNAWARWSLALFVIALGIVRNSFRILVLAYLCVRVDPSYIDSPIHKQGGPLFFILSLIPFGFVLYLLCRKRIANM